MKVSGARAIIECLMEQGVDTIFGYPGGAILPFYDALYDAPIRHILTTHEQGAVHAADGYARASGKVGVCVATSGPGATNLITGLATAFMDSVPVVAITGQVPTELLGRDAFQETDTTGITMPITKHNYLVTDAQRLVEIIREAFYIARSGRPGPVVIDIPRDIQTAEVDFKAIELVSANRSWEPSVRVLNQLQRAAAAISTAKRPVMHIGGGIIIADSYNEVQQFAEKCQLPIVSTLMGLGGIKASHPQFVGLTGLHGSKVANKVVKNADVVLAVGSRFNDRVTGSRHKYAADKRIIHIDIDASEIDKNVETNIGVTGPMAKVISLLESIITVPDTSLWWQSIAEWQKGDGGKPIDELTGPWIMNNINEQVKDHQVIFATDVGQHQMWAAQGLKIETPRTWVTSGGFGAMGFGLPAAIGAQFAMPHKRVIHIAGDGGFKMTGAELYTAACHNLPLISVIVNNRSLGMVRQLQHVFCQQRYSCSLLPDIDFVAYSNAFGINAVAVDTTAGFSEAFAKALAADKPQVIVANIKTEELVTPMLALDSTLDKYLLD